MEGKISAAKLIIRFASLYNASALAIFLVPGALTLFGVEEPYSSFWRVLPALLASFGAVTLWISSNNIVQFAAFPVWNGIIRIVFATIALAAGYHQIMGAFILLLAVGDLLIGILTITLVKRALNKSIIHLLANK
ncbi:hypothetical protein [Algoriphagus sp.]|uniref:hypothetical protein n=1 Tax=Algoriphagus sp. TaxID=1872435 RepID=UPI00391DD962